MSTVADCFVLYGESMAAEMLTVYSSFFSPLASIQMHEENLSVTSTKKVVSIYYPFNNIYSCHHFHRNSAALTVVLLVLTIHISISAILCQVTPVQPNFF